MGDGIWTSTDAPWGSEIMGSLIAGVEKWNETSSTTMARSLLSDTGSMSNAMYRLVGDSPILGTTYQEDNKDRNALDFGVFREAVLNTTRKKNDDPIDLKYWAGPWQEAAKSITSEWAARKSEQTSLRGPTAPTLPIGTAVKAATRPGGWETVVSALADSTTTIFGEDAATIASALAVSTDYSSILSTLLGETAPTISFTAITEPDWDVYGDDLAVPSVAAGDGAEGEEPDPGTVAAPSAITVTDATVSAIAAAPEVDFEYSAPDPVAFTDVGDPSAITATSVVPGSVSSVPEVDVDYSDPSAITFDAIDAPSSITPATVTAPTIFSSDIAAEAIAAPSSVDVTDLVDDAVDSFTALATLRYAADEANILAGAFMTRSLMSTALDNALAILAANKNAQILDYDKTLRVRQTELQAQMDAQHQQNTLERNTRNATLALDAAKTNAQIAFEVVKANAAMSMEADRTNAELALDAAKTMASLTLDAAKANAGLTIDAGRVNTGTVIEGAKILVDMGRTNAQIALDAAKTNAALSTDASRANAELDMDAAKTVATLTLEAAKTNASLDVEAGRANAGTAIEGIRVQADVAKTDAELAIETAKTNATLTTDVSKVNAAMATDASKADEELALDAAKTAASLATQAAIAGAANLTEASRTNATLAVDVSRANAENELRRADTLIRADIGMATAKVQAGSANYDAQTAQLKARTDILDMIYRTTIAWMQAKASVVTNAGPLASIINATNELNLKADEMDRSAYMSYLNYEMDATRSISAGYEGMAQLQWKAMLQNMMVAKEAVSSFQGIGGVEHHPSGFEKVAQTASLGMGMASSLINIGMVLS